MPNTGVLGEQTLRDLSGSIDAPMGCRAPRSAATSSTHRFLHERADPYLVGARMAPGMIAENRVRRVMFGEMVSGIHGGGYASFLAGQHPGITELYRAFGNAGVAGDGRHEQNSPNELIGCIVDAGENAKNGNSGSFRYYRIAQLA